MCRDSTENCCLRLYVRVYVPAFSYCSSFGSFFSLIAPFYISFVLFFFLEPCFSIACAYIAATYAHTRPFHNKRYFLHVFFPNRVVSFSELFVLTQQTWHRKRAFFFHIAANWNAKLFSCCCFFCFFIVVVVLDRIEALVCTFVFPYRRVQWGKPSLIFLICLLLLLLLFPSLLRRIRSLYKLFIFVFFCFVIHTSLLESATKKKKRKL